MNMHRFGHTFAINVLRSGMSEPMLRLLGGWKKIPDTYLRTLSVEDAARVTPGTAGGGIWDPGAGPAPRAG